MSSIDHSTMRVGVLGAARIVKSALLRPAERVSGVQVAAIAARDSDRARVYATKHGIPAVHESYETLLADPTVDAVYIPLPSALHARWTVAAIQAGKHVLCEKPFASNTSAAAEVAVIADASDRVVMEAYHSYHHPLRRRLLEILGSGELGEIRAATATACAPIPPGRDIRWNFELGGGGLLDVGYYPLRLLRELFGEITTVAASARVRGQVDGRLDASMCHESGVRTRLVSSLWSWPLISMKLEVRGSLGHMRVGSPYHPQLGGAIRISTSRGQRTERPSRRSTYAFQLEAFRAAVQDGGPIGTGAQEAVRQLRAIDELYIAAGLAARPSVQVTAK